MSSLYDHKSDKLLPTSTPPHGLEALEVIAAKSRRPLKCSQCEIYKGAWVIRGVLISISTSFFGFGVMVLLRAHETGSVNSWISGGFGILMSLVVFGCWLRLVRKTRLMSKTWYD